jgi:hypothetical protein
LSRGGGVTGLVRGYHLHDDGRVEAWQRRPGKPQTLRWQRQVAAHEVLDLQRDLEATGALKAAHRETGNMTTRLTYDRPDTSYAWSWTGDPPEELAAWVGETRRFCAALAPD